MAYKNACVRLVTREKKEGWGRWEGEVSRSSQSLIFAIFFLFSERGLPKSPINVDSRAIYKWGRGGKGLKTINKRGV